MVWQTGDVVGPTNLNTKGASATSSAGFSSNTLIPESGNTLVINSQVSMTAPLYLGGVNPELTGATSIAHLQIASSLTRDMMLLSFVSDVASEPVLRFAKGRGTFSNTTYSLSGDILGEVSSLGWDGIAFNRAGFLNFTADGDHGQAALPTKMTVNLASAGTNIPTPYWSFRATGDIQPITDDSYNIGGTTNRLHTVTAGSQGFVAHNIGASASMRARRGDGTITAPTAIASGEQLGAFLYSGHNGTSYQDSAAVVATAAESFTTVALGTKLIFETTSTQTTTLSSRWVMTADGHWVPAVTNTIDIGGSAATARPRAIYASTAIVNPDGTATQPGSAFSSEQSLGLYRSAASTLALSYGTLNLRNGALSLRTTASAGSTSNLTQGEFCLVNVSTTSAQLAFRSGATTYLFNAVVASP